MSNEAGSAFDPNQFLDAQQSEVNELLPPLPTDRFYDCVIGEVKQESGLIGKGERTGEPWISVIIPLKVQIPQDLQDSLGYPAEYNMMDRAFLDLTPQRTIDNSKGRNKTQKAYRDALDMNKPGDVWAWRKAVGQVVKLKIKHELFEGRIVQKPDYVVKR